MRKQQRIQLLQFIAVWILIYLFCAFVVKQSFVDLILKHRFFFLVASVSYFYYYSIQYEPDKKYELIRNALIFGNLYLFAHIFFRPLLNIPDALFVLLGLIILGFWGTTKMKSRRKYLLQSLGVVLCFFILISGTLYFYPDKPDIEGFISSRNYEISVVGASDTVLRRDAYIQISNGRKNEEYEISPGFVKVISESCEISYPSSRSEREEKVVFITPGGEIFGIFPQTKVQLTFEGSKLIRIYKQAGKVAILSGAFDEGVDFVGDVDILSSGQLEELEELQSGYRYSLVSYLKDQVSESNISLANGTVMYDIDGKILRFLARMFPASFGKNLKNYNEFMHYFSWINQDDIDLGRYSMKSSGGGTMSSMLKTMQEGIKEGRQDTYLLKKY